MSTGKLVKRWYVDPVIFIFKKGFIRKVICKIVGLDIKDRVDAVEARIERRLWQKKLRVNNQTIFVSKQTYFVATLGLRIVVPRPPYVVSAGLFVRLPSVGLNDWDLEHRVVVRYVFIG